MALCTALNPADTPRRSVSLIGCGLDATHAQSDSGYRSVPLMGSALGETTPQSAPRTSYTASRTLPSTSAMTNATAA
jgi:hypothetical protein